MYNYVDNQPIPVTPSEQEAVACYQPVLALDTRQIVGYEVLGRRQRVGRLETLGPFFTDPRVPAADQIRIDRHIREQALATLSRTDDTSLLFLNLKPSWMYQSFQETGELLTLQLLKRYGVDPARIVIEVTEEAFRGSMVSLSEVIDVYRQAGCQIAIDDVGTGFNNADRIAQIGPSLLKVDIHVMKKSASHSGYFGVLRSFSTLAEQIGASLLIEGVETREDLQRAVEIGARYVQGYLFAPAEPAFRAADSYSVLIEEELHAHRQRLYSVEHYWQSQSCLLQELVDRTAGVADGSLPDDTGIERLLDGLDDSCIRVYICQESGLQLSSNYRREETGWCRQTQYQGANWSWRPYFIASLLAMKRRGEAGVSLTYTDLETKMRIRSVSIQLGEGRVLFVDMLDPTAVHGG
ncbi:EAL domain-containing protein [Paenibacillus daejeonensis]|uniref:EAL domain-containing protein n=1 Tax=Paenibacillus daejeonensis TaxID=135193 RepID=UPI0003692C4A|nr:EAL domain-containing protein [Paenibacillus daejeonensis]